MDKTQVHLSNDGLSEDKTDSTRIWFIFTNVLTERLDGRECWQTYIVMKNILYIRNDCNVEDKTDYISVLDSTILKQQGVKWNK